jgi:hypothetical protein
MNPVCRTSFLAKRRIALAWRALTTIRRHGTLLPSEQAPSRPKGASLANLPCYLMEMLGNSFCRKMDKNPH